MELFNPHPPVVKEIVSLPKKVAPITIVPDEWELEVTTLTRSLQIKKWFETIDDFAFCLCDIYPITCECWVILIFNAFIIPIKL